MKPIIPPLRDHGTPVMAGTGRAMLAEGSTQQAMADVRRFFSKTRVQHQASEDERTRLARDLHDGILQALTGAILQLTAASKMIPVDPEGARAHLDSTSLMLAEEQRELRMFVQRLKPELTLSKVSPEEIATALQKLRQRTEQLSAVRVDLRVVGPGCLPRRLGDEIYRIVQEGLANVTRHARANSACVEIAIQFDRVLIKVRDDGNGFPFRGTYDLAALAARNQGPASLRGRVAALGGELFLDSSMSGTTIDITLPISHPELDWPQRLHEGPA